MKLNRREEPHRPSFSEPRKKLELGGKEADMKRAITSSIVAVVLLVAVKST
jgi:hypothetical protein